MCAVMSKCRVMDLLDEKLRARKSTARSRIKTRGGQKQNTAGEKAVHILTDIISQLDSDRFTPVKNNT